LQLVDDLDLLDEQRAYYRARAGEYDRWWLREGRFDRGEEANARWFDEIATLEHALAHFQAAGDVLELACGTGLWTKHLARTARTLTAVDSSPEVLDINRSRVNGEHVRYVRADLFEWQPPEQAFDVCFFSFWLSHVPDNQFAAFWGGVARALRPGGRVFLIDSARSERSGAADHIQPAEGHETMTRRLDDGTEFRIVKRFYDCGWLERRLAELGWRFEAHPTGEFFIHAAGNRAG
jgi:demethylmenaquinone methyltransferase/2-methoxy-6-polyprenyl-1,4-benzoquinol methylase